MSDEKQMNENRIIDVDLQNEMQKSFLDYSMSVIVSRALPDVRDGLKPVHRRILYTMYERGLDPTKPYHKCADTVGSVLGSYQRPYMMRWCVLPRTSPCAICSSTVTETSAP